MPLRWYAAETYPNAELAAASRLRRQSFEPYCPFRTLRRAIRRGTSLIRKLPLLPGYIFVNLDIEDDPQENWKRVNNTRAILHLLPASDRPLPIPKGEVENIIANELAGNYVWPRSDVMRPGTPLRVREGLPLADQLLECMLADDDRGMVKALWSCLGRKVVVTVPLDGVRVDTDSVPSPPLK